MTLMYIFPTSGMDFDSFSESYFLNTCYFYIYLFLLILLEKAKAAHTSVLAWRILGTGQPGGLRSMGSHRVRHDWSDLAAVAAWSFAFLILIFFSLGWLPWMFLQLYFQQCYCLFFQQSYFKFLSVTPCLLRVLIFGARCCRFCSVLGATSSFSCPRILI